MASPLIGIHAALGEIGISAFFWTFIEMIAPDKKRLRRAKVAAMIGVIFFFMSWIIGGYYYSTDYGTNVKPAIKEGPQPWAHGVMMEAKEHIFLFLPFLGIVVFSLVSLAGERMIKDAKLRKSFLIVTAIVVLIGLAMAVMGYLISSGFRSALEAART